jgi:prepilin-type N-terminal cleavage/methylation domain-containing protein
MEIYPLHRHKNISARGFTMLEVLVAIFVMTVGLVALSALAAKTMSGTESSRFAGLAANLASEKLEDLNRWPYWDPNVYVASASTAGSLSSDVQTSVTSGITETVNYYDDVSIGNASGAVTETVLGLVGGTEKYTTLTHNPDGTMTQTQATAAPSAVSSAVTFHRRWIIEMDQPVTGVKRVTVLVTLTNSVMDPPVSFQMSMVRTASP